jgi:hypothetical protein
MTMVTLKSVTHTLETDLETAEFVVLPVFGSTGQPEYQIELHLSRTDGLTLDELEGALRSAQDRLAPGVA